MAGSLAGMEQSPDKFTREVFRRCRGLTVAKDSGASWDDNFDGQNKTTIKWFSGIENIAKP